MKKEPKHLLLIALLSAISAILMIFQLPLFSGFMQLDFSILPIFVALYVLSLKNAFIVLFLRSLLKLFLFNEGLATFIGMPMNVIAMSLLLLSIWFFQRKTNEFQIIPFIRGGILGTILSTTAMMILNVVYAIPAYEFFMNFHLPKSTTTWILTIVLPFNLLQGFLLTTASLALLIALLPIIHILQEKE